MQTLAQQIISFYENLELKTPLPKGVSLLHPFQDHPEILPAFRAFYRKFYSDNQPRRLILGINPGRFGAGKTGIPFTDTERLTENCGIPFGTFQTRETSSVFVYEVIGAYGGVRKFYDNFYISSVCPLGFTVRSKRGNTVNYNYYDDKALTEAVYNFIRQSLRAQIDFGLKTDVVYSLGSGKNMDFLQKFNAREGFFGKIVPLAHPRYVMQYKSGQKDQFIEQYLEALQ